MTTISIGGVAFEIGSLGQWVAATATFLAVLVALFGESYRRWRRRPKLELSIELKPPDCHKAKLTTTYLRGSSSTIDVYYLRLWITNSGRTRAEFVQVYLAALDSKNVDGTFANLSRFPPMNLRWSHSPSNPEIYAAGISPNMGRHCDLAHISYPGNPSVPTQLEFDLEMIPASTNHIVPAGIYRAKLRLAAANCAPRDYLLKINLTGKWFKKEAEMFQDGISITRFR